MIRVKLVRLHLKSKIGISESFFILLLALTNSGSLEKKLIVESVVVTEHSRGKLFALFKLSLLKQVLQLAKLNVKSCFVFHFLFLPTLLLLKIKFINQNLTESNFHN